jgi:hypothetical protein
MLIQAIQKGLLLIFCSCVGLAAGVIVVTPLIALMNFRAQDGPIFPAPLVAFAVAAPVSILLFIVQGLVLFYEWLSWRILLNGLFFIGLVVGLAAGLTPYFLAVVPYQSGSEFLALFAFAGLGIFIGLSVFGCHWAANKVQAYFTGRKVPEAFEAS